MYAAVLVAWGLALTGCMTSTGMARTLDAGELQFSAAPGVVSSFTPDPEQGVFGVHNPYFEVGLRYGLQERLDVGLKGIPGVALQGDVRYALLRAPSLQSGLDLTVAPSVTYNFQQDISRPLLWLSLPLLLGVNVGGSQLVLGPRATYLVYPSLASGPGRLLVGSSLGVAVPVGYSLRLVPEVTLLAAPFNLPGSLPTNAFMTQVNLGVMWGGYEK